MSKKCYAILIVDHLNNGYTTLYDKVFNDENSAKREIKILADNYIENKYRKEPKIHLEYNDSMLMISSKPTKNCMFAEITYYIQEVIFQNSSRKYKKVKNGLGLFAKNELEYIIKNMKKDNKDSIYLQKEINKDIFELIDLFSKQEHSGTSAFYVINNFKRLANWMPISPLTGKDDEWFDVETNKEKPLQQNKRYSGLFREAGNNASAYDINAFIFSDNGGVTWFTSNINKDFQTPIVFPYIPPSKPHKIYIRWLDENHEKYEVVESEDERKKQREKFKHEMKDAGW